jgi:hypothetical protein
MDDIDKLLSVDVDLMLSLSAYTENDYPPTLRLLLLLLLLLRILLLLLLLLLLLQDATESSRQQRKNKNNTRYTTTYQYKTDIAQTQEDIHIARTNLGKSLSCQPPG